MKTKMKFSIKRCCACVLTLCIISLLTLNANAAPNCSICATPSSTGIETCCQQGSPLCNPCVLATVCEGDKIDFRHVEWSNPPPHSDKGCAPTYWAIYTSCSVWTPGTLFMPMFTTPTSLFSLNTAGMPPGTYWIMAACSPIGPGGSGTCGTNVFSFVIQDCSPTEPCKNCVCEEIPMSVTDLNIDNDGFASANLNIGGPVLNVSKIRVTLINYHSTVLPDCKKCAVADQEIFGDLTSAQNLYGTYAQMGTYNPNASTWYSREATWCFEPALPEFNTGPIELTMRFPPVLPLECCKNEVDFCFRVEVWDNDCKACERLVCSSPIHHRKLEKLLPDTKTKGALKAIPNPAQNSFNLLTPEEDAVGKVSIYDANGSLLKQFNTNSSITHIETKGWTAGIYIIKYKTATKSYQEKLVIEK